jgi:hypothetical protein
MLGEHREGVRLSVVPGRSREHSMATSIDLEIWVTRNVATIYGNSAVRSKAQPAPARSAHGVAGVLVVTTNIAARFNHQLPRRAFCAQRQTRVAARWRPLIIFHRSRLSRGRRPRHVLRNESSRDVNGEGVSLVMDVFFRSRLGLASSTPAASPRVHSRH